MGSEIPGACEPPSPTLTTHFSSAASTGVRDDVGLFEVVKLGQELSQSGRGAAGSIAMPGSGSTVPKLSSYTSSITSPSATWYASGYTLASSPLTTNFQKRHGAEDDIASVRSPPGVVMENGTPPSRL